ncbi:zinc finger BED domain-containing protein 4-like [Prorops nasuta]|uniref:zinc finger BED domain-containing protein 4-like n=1 Tax=Prorops nasuta TaxID=863751 RepID=UPI0034D00D54
MMLLRQNSFQEGGKKAVDITNNLVFMLAKDNMPFLTVEKEGFRRFMKIVSPLYKIPSRNSITSLMEEKYNVLSSAMKLKLSGVEHISLTTDIWTDPLNTKAYLGLTAHFINNNKHKSVMIGVTELSERHSSEYIEMWLRNMVDDWKINPESIVVVVCDNGANIKKAVKDAFGADKQLSCFAHTLNLIPAKVVENNDINSVCKKIKTIVTFFKKSVSAMDDLRAVSDLKLIQSVDTRWNSMHDMLIRFIELSEKIGSILLNIPTAPMMITATELQIIKELVDLLKPFKEATKIISGEYYLTASKVIPVINTLQKTLMLSQPITKTANHMKELLLEQFQMRFENIEKDTILAKATILDPRFKSIHFNDKDACSEIIMDIATMINSTILNEEDENNLVDINYNNSFWLYHQTLVNQSKERHSFNPREYPDDLKFYLSQLPINIDACPIQFWKMNNTALSKLGQKYLAAVASSVPCERLFSKAGRIVTESRNRLSGEHLHQLLFLSSLPLEDWM